jgi:hypothetical protein
VEPTPLYLRPLIGILYRPWTVDGDGCRTISGMNVRQGKPKYSEETYPSAVVPTTNPIQIDRGSNPSLCSGKPATGWLS